MTFSALSAAPKLSGCAATTIVPTAATVDAPAWLSSQLRARYAALPPIRMARHKTGKLLVRMILSLPASPNCRFISAAYR
jgi:hypothetical protein